MSAQPWIPVPPQTAPEQEYEAQNVTYTSTQPNNFFVVSNPGRKDYPNQNLLNPYPD